MITIAIPTYNRNKEVVETIKSVINQFSDDCHLLILDNASDVSVEESLAKQNIHLNNRERIRLIRNPVNIGGQANLLRCIELCTTKWLWILGDDDIPNSNAVEVILWEIESHADFTFLNYCSPYHKRYKDVITSGITDFVHGIDNWGQINFTSVCLLRADKLKPYIRFGISYSYSWSSINACLLACLVKEGGEALFSSTVILSEINKAGDDRKWFPMGPNLGKFILLELLPDVKDKKILLQTLRHKPSLEYAVTELLHSNDSKENILYTYNSLIFRLYYFDRSLVMSTKILLYRLLLHVPSIGRKLVNVIMKNKGKAISKNIDPLKRL